MKKRFFILVIYFGFFNAVKAQDTSMPVITGEFDNLNVEQFLLQLERKSGLTFYFDKSQLDSITINIKVNKKPLPDVLKLAFNDTKIGFAVDDHHNVFISKGQVVQTELPEGFYPINKKEKKLLLDG